MKHFTFTLGAISVGAVGVGGLVYWLATGDSISLKDDLRFIHATLSRMDVFVDGGRLCCELSRDSRVVATSAFRSSSCVRRCARDREPSFRRARTASISMRTFTKTSPRTSCGKAARRCATRA